MTDYRLRKLLGCCKWLPVLLAYQSVGCLPDNAFKQVTGENVLLSTAIVIQTLTSLFFNQLFGFI